MRPVRRLSTQQRGPRSTVTSRTNIARATSNAARRSWTGGRPRRRGRRPGHGSGTTYDGASRSASTHRPKVVRVPSGDAVKRGHNGTQQLLPGRRSAHHVDLPVLLDDIVDAGHTTDPLV